MMLRKQCLTPHGTAWRFSVKRSEGWLDQRADVQSLVEPLPSRLQAVAHSAGDSALPEAEGHRQPDGRFGARVAGQAH